MAAMRFGSTFTGLSLTTWPKKFISCLQKSNLSVLMVKPAVVSFPNHGIQVFDVFFIGI